MRLPTWDDATVAYYRTLWKRVNSAHKSTQRVPQLADGELEFGKVDSDPRWRVFDALADLLSTQPPILPPERMLRRRIHEHCAATEQRLFASEDNEGEGVVAPPIPEPPPFEAHLELWTNVAEKAEAWEKYGPIERLDPTLHAFRSHDPVREEHLDPLWVQTIEMIRSESVNPVHAQLLHHFDGEDNRAKAYRAFAIPKRRGGTREIKTPSKSLKWLQRSLLQVLTHLFPRHKCAVGFEREKSIVTHAKAHAGKRWVYVVDIKDFFPSVTRNRVFGMLRAYPFNASKHVARYLANLTTIDGALPQGAPTSPILANLLCRRLDSRLFKWARERGYQYTRYADDLAFSTNRTEFSESDRSTIVRIIEDEGFEVHPDKKRLMPWHGRQLVTGLVVNEKPNVPRERIRGLRALLHNVDKHGWKSQIQRKVLFEKDDEDWHRYKKRSLTAREFREYELSQEKEHLLVRPEAAIPDAKSIQGLQQVVQGRIEFVGMVKGTDSPVYRRLRDKYDRLVGRRSQFDDEQKTGLERYEPAPADDTDTSHPEKTNYYLEVKDILRAIRREEKDTSDLWAWVDKRANQFLEAQWLLQTMPSLDEDEWQRAVRGMAYAIDTSPHETALFFREFKKGRPFRQLLHAPHSTTPDGKFDFGAGSPISAGELLGRCRKALKQRTLPNRLHIETRKVLDRCDEWLEVHPHTHPYTAGPIQERLRIYKREVRFDDEPGFDLHDRLEKIVEEAKAQGGIIDVKERFDVFYTYTPSAIDGIKLLLSSLVEKAIVKADGGLVEPVTVRTEWEPIGRSGQVKIRLQAHDGPVGVKPRLGNLLRGDTQTALDHLRGFARWTIEAPFLDGTVHAFDVTQNSKVDPTRDELPGFLHELTFYQ